MRTFLITFYPATSSQASAIVSRIKQLGSWAKLTDNSFCLRPMGLSTIDIRDRLSQNLQENIRIFVVDITDSSWGSYGIPPEVTNWLKQ